MTSSRVMPLAMGWGPSRLAASGPRAAQARASSAPPPAPRRGGGQGQRAAAPPATSREGKPAPPSVGRDQKRGAGLPVPGPSAAPVPRQGGPSPSSGTSTSGSERRSAATSTAPPSSLSSPPALAPSAGAAAVGPTRAALRDLLHNVTRQSALEHAAAAATDGRAGVAGPGPGPPLPVETLLEYERKVGLATPPLVFVLSVHTPSSCPGLQADGAIEEAASQADSPFPLLLHSNGLNVRCMLRWRAST